MGVGVRVGVRVGGGVGGVGVGVVVVVWVQWSVAICVMERVLVFFFLRGLGVRMYSV